MASAKHFSETGLPPRMIQLWIILIGRAHNRQTITYAELAKLMLGGEFASFGKRAPQWKGLRLGQLYTYCRRHDLPLLPVLVVLKANGEPAPLDELYGERPVGVERERVFDFDWYGLYPPSETDLLD